MNTELSELDVPQNLSVIDAQKESLTNAASLAKEIKAIIKSSGLSANFGGPRDHVFLDAWLTVAAVHNHFPHSEIKTVTTDPASGVQTIHARAWLTNSHGDVISSAEAYCSTDERNWSTRPFYARASMAQTRAIGRAIRGKHAWILTMAGYATTPAEEMDGCEPLSPSPQLTVSASTHASPIKSSPQIVASPEPNPQPIDTNKLMLSKLVVGEMVGVDGHPCKICGQTKWEVKKASQNSKNAGRLYFSCATGCKNPEKPQYTIMGGFCDEVLTSKTQIG